MGAFSHGAKLATGVTEAAAVLEAAGVTLAETEAEGDGEGGPSHTPKAYSRPQGAILTSDIETKLAEKRLQYVRLPTVSNLYTTQDGSESQMTAQSLAVASSRYLLIWTCCKSKLSGNS